MCERHMRVRRERSMKIPTKPTVGSRWRHWKNDKIYTVAGFALFCDTDHEKRLLVIYLDEEGDSFARSEYEWHNTMPGGKRRFTEIE